MHDSPRVDPVRFVATSAPVSAVTFLQHNTDQAYVLAGDVRGRVAAWDLQSWRRLADIDAFDVCGGRAAGVQWLAALEDCAVAQARLAGIVVLRPAEAAWRTISALDAEHEGFCRGHVLQDDRLVAFPEATNTVVVARIRRDGEFEVITKLVAETSEGNLMALKFIGTEQASLLLAAYESGKLLLWNWTQQKVMCDLHLAPLVPTGLDFDTKSNCGVAVGNQDYLVSFSLNSEMLQVMCKRPLPSTGLSDVIVRRPDLKIVVTSSWDSTVRLFSWKNPEKLKPLGALKFHTDSVETVACSLKPVKSIGGKRLVAAGSKDGRVSFWDVYNE